MFIKMNDQPRLKVALQRARSGKKLTRTQLAYMINVKETLIASYENGTSIPEGNTRAKLNRVLGITLPKL